MAQAVKTNEFFYTPAKSSSKGKKFINCLQILAIVLVVFVVLYLVILLPNQVDGISMMPNFMDEELLFTDKVINLVGSTEFGKSIDYDYGRGDVVVFPHGDIALIKRIIAIGGDSVRIEGGRVYLNDQLLDEEYIPDGVETIPPFGSAASLQEGETVVVPEGEYFLMGDNRPNSKDSRFSDIGFLERSEISGRVFLRYWPLNTFGIIGRGKQNVGGSL